MDNNIEHLSISIDEYDEAGISSSTPIRSPYVEAAHITLLKQHLEEQSRSVNIGRGERNPSKSIFRCPPYLEGILDDRTYLPEVVSIGPYHRGRSELMAFEVYKWYYLYAYISTSVLDRHSAISTSVERMANCMRNAKSYYSDMPSMADYDFIQMMILDCFFIIEVLNRLGSSHHEEQGMHEIEEDPILAKPWLIPMIIVDLLKLENQLPFFVLEAFWQPKEGESIKTVAMRVFNLLFQLPWDARFKTITYEPKHLLDLFHHCLRPSEHKHKTRTVGFQGNWLCVDNRVSKDEPYPSTQSIQSAKQLRYAGIKFKPKKANSFLDIKFRNRVLEMPSITINDWTTTILFNCVALEQSRNDDVTFFTSYIVFMKSLIYDPRDAAYLCSDGIITSFSKNDQFVARCFNDLGGMVGFNVRNTYLDKQIREVETYYSSHWATMKRQYFSSPWATISVLYALLLLLLSLAQTFFAILVTIRNS